MSQTRMQEHDFDAEDDADDSVVSKSQRKRESTALQDLGKELFELSRDQLKKMDLPEALLGALLEAKRLTSHGAMRRQMQFIGKVMRDIEVEPINQQLAVIRGESNIAKAAFHALENWRMRLIEDDAALNEWLALQPDTDVQQIRQLIRNARKEATEAKPPKSSRALFKLLREHSERKA
jgi:ribosome-associated protein